MSTELLSKAARLSDRELLEQIQRLVQREREATVALIAHLAVFAERGLYLAEGCSSMYTYCRQVLHLSEYAAYSRIEAANAVRRFPDILDLLAEGSLTLTTVGLLVPELTYANHRELLESARYKSKRDIQELIASLRPRPPVPSMVRRLPSPMTALELQEPPAGADSANPALSAVPISPTRPTCQAIVPIAPERYKVQFTASAEMRQRLEYAQDLLRHQIPNGDVTKVIDLALMELIKKLEREKFAAAERPRSGRGTDPASRHIPAQVKRKVWARDGGRCAFVAKSGRRCSERAFLEFHHVQPYSAGGKATVDNIQVRCRAHNGYEAGLYLGQRMPRG